jgi:hypothetical protein
MYLSLRHFSIFLLFSVFNNVVSFSRMLFASMQLFINEFFIFFNSLCLFLNHFSIFSFYFKYSSFVSLLANNFSVNSSSYFSFFNWSDSLPFRPSSIFWMFIILNDSWDAVCEWAKVKDSSSYEVFSFYGIKNSRCSLFTSLEEYLFVKELSSLLSYSELYYFYSELAYCGQLNIITLLYLPVYYY